MTRSSSLILASLTIGVLAGCATSTKDYKSEGEKFLESPEVAKQVGYAFSNALCEVPQSITIGTQYSCSATDDERTNWEFIIEITGDRTLTVINGKVKS